jgi:hypothetical protein
MNGRRTMCGSWQVVHPERTGDYPRDVPGVVVGRASAELVVASDLCVKSGRRTTDRVIVRGSTTPGWVNMLLIFTIIGWLFATGMSARRYRLAVPFSHKIHGRWRWLNRTSWLVGVGGAGGTIWAVSAGVSHAWMLLGVSVVGFAAGIANGTFNNVGVRINRDDELVLTRVHPAAVAAIRRAGSVRA